MHQKEYQIIRFLADSHFQDIATQLNGLVRFFDSNTIGPLMYNEELEFFIVKFRKTNSMRWPYLRYAVNDMYKKYYRRHRMQPNQPVEDPDGEWVDIEDDYDDEITFKVNTDPDD